MKIRIAIVEDENHYNQALAKIFDFQKDMKVVGQFFSGKSAADELEKLAPDIVMLDIQLPDFSGHKLLSMLRPKMPKTNFIMCTSFEDEEKIFTALKHGANGYLLKGESMEKILVAVREAHDGGAPMSSAIAKKVMAFFHVRNPVNEGLAYLTERETEILKILSDGFQYKEIADKMCISMETVKKHLANIYRKLHVKNKVEALNKFNLYKN